MPETAQALPRVTARVATFTREYPSSVEVERWAVQCPFCDQVHLHAPVEGPVTGHCDDDQVRAAYVVVAPKGVEE